ncbi:MAG: hypothetical protein ACXABY_04445, partial [Candidatus Thorarchaeota archaeon]
REAYTGLPHVRVDEYHHDPIVIDAGTIVGIPTGGVAVAKFVPAVLSSGATYFTGGAVGAAQNLKIFGSTEASTTWGLPAGASGDLTVNYVKPMGVVFQPIYSFYLETRFTNYKRTHSVGIVTDYVIQVPATNTEEVAIDYGDVVMLGTGNHYGAGWTDPYDTHKIAGRYAKFDRTQDWGHERVVGRCLKKLLLGSTSNTGANETLATAITNGTFTISAAASAEFSDLDKVQTVPGLGLSGSGTSGIPAYFLDARSDGDDNFYALTILVRL